MPQTIAALQAGLTVRVIRLVRLDFVSGTRFLHTDCGPIATRAPGVGSGPPTQIWEGVGRLGAIGDIERAVVPSGGGTKLTLSGVDPELAGKALGDPSDYRGQPARIYEQFFSGDLTLYDSPLCIDLGLMDRMPISEQGGTATITLQLVTPLYKRRRPPYAYLSSSSQRKLHPGDAGADEIPALVQRTIKWPNY